MGTSISVHFVQQSLSNSSSRPTVAQHTGLWGMPWEPVVYIYIQDARIF